MTNREQYLKSMLNYYEISLDGNRDEKMTTQQKKKFINNLLTSYDNIVIDEIIKKVKDMGKKGGTNPDDISDADFYDSDATEENNDHINDYFDQNEQSDSLFPTDMNSSSNRRIGSKNEDNSFNPFNLNPEIEKFISWISSVLYSADHKVTITQDEQNNTNIRLEKIKKKRGGKKK